MKRLSLFVSLAALALCLAVGARRARAQSYGMYPALSLPLSVSYGGTGLSSYTNAYPGGFVCVSSTWALTQMPSMGPGGLPIGTAVNSVASTGTLTAGGSITITNAAGSITVAVTTLGVDSTKMGNASVDSEKLAKNAVNGEKVLALALDSTKLASRSVDSEKVVLASIGREHVANLTLDSAKLAARSVDSEKLALLSISREHIRAGGVDTGNIATDAVSSSRLLSDLAGLNKVTAGAMTVASGANGSVSVVSPVTIQATSSMTFHGSLELREGASAIFYENDSSGVGVSLRGILYGAGRQRYRLYGSDGVGTLDLNDGAEVLNVHFAGAGNSYLTGGSLGVGTNKPATLVHNSTGVLTIDGNASGLVISSGATTGSVVLGVIDTSKSVDWGATAGNSCDTSTIGTPSATLGRWRCSISASVNVEDATCILRAFVSAADVITIKRCNVGAGACADPAAATHYVSCVIQ